MRAGHPSRRLPHPADAHIIAFERVREDLHALPRDAPRELGLKAMEHGLRVALITVLEANVSTILAMASLRLQAGVGEAGRGPGGCRGVDTAGSRACGPSPTPACMPTRRAGCSVRHRHRCHCGVCLHRAHFGEA